MREPALFISSMGIICALGAGHQEVLGNLLESSTIDRVSAGDMGSELCPYQGVVPDEGLDVWCGHSRNNRLLSAAMAQIAPEIERLKSCYGAERIGVVLGTSTSGTLEAEAAMTLRQMGQVFPEDYHYRIQEMGDPSGFLAKSFGITGPCYTLSTACSSSGKVFSAGRRLIQSGLCDALVVGGVDSLCQLTIHGFSALESVSAELCNPFSSNRNGINLGEGAALFTLTRETADIALLGVGESSDAWHISAPHPEGRGAVAAMKGALNDAGMIAGDMGYLNLHGTATPLNDAMESLAVERLLGRSLLCSSTKPFTGHTLGAAGAVEAALSWLLLSPYNEKRQLPVHCWDGQVDPELPNLRFTVPGDVLAENKAVIMSNSFAFGGSNVSLILGRCAE